MKKLLGLLLAGVAVAGTVWAFLGHDNGTPATASYRTASAERGTIIAQVTTSGAIAPVTTVIVGSQLSGQVIEILADYNSEVKNGQVLARLNSDQIRAKLDGARADLAQARASRVMLDAQLEKSRADAQKAAANADDMGHQLEKTETQLADAEKTLARQTSLNAQGIVATAALQTAQTQRDTLRAARESAHAQIASAKAQIAALAADQKMIAAQMVSAEAQIAQRSAVVRQIEVDLGNTDIRSPVDGVVVQRNVELGQPVAASLQAPTLFLVAQDLRQVQIQANVDEADVGRVRDGQPVSFTVNAYPGRTFQGKVKLVRLGSQTVQNVVIYTTVIDVDNPDIALKPGMTANLRIVTEQRDNVVRVPNAALRW
ncbi:MAG TPA: efflux RND transporter periplasmic adaptor subunit, partial [Beijerinckiaceae bacterium]|nr:efflux RND transporter periplasmic adaptor subunit [Beijerinckiaceae bacterium]